MTEPTSAKDRVDAAADALDRAFDTESADRGAAQLAEDSSLRAELDAARGAAAEEARRPLEASHAEYIDSKTVPPAQRVRMPSQKLYVNEAVAFPQKGIPTVRGMRPVLGPSPGTPADEALTEHETKPEHEAQPDDPLGAARSHTSSTSRLVLGVMAALVLIAGASWLAMREPSGQQVAPPITPSGSPSANPATEVPSSAVTPTAFTPSPVDPPPTAEPNPSATSSASPATSSSAKSGRNPADFGGMQF